MDSSKIEIGALIQRCYNGQRTVREDWVGVIVEVFTNGFVEVLWLYKSTNTSSHRFAVTELIEKEIELATDINNCGVRLYDSGFLKTRAIIKIGFSKLKNLRKNKHLPGVVRNRIDAYLESVGKIKPKQKELPLEDQEETNQTQDRKIFFIFASDNAHAMTQKEAEEQLLEITAQYPGIKFTVGQMIKHAVQPTEPVITKA